HFDELDLIHMNGRIYDPVTGRFLSADPTVESPSNMQTYDRYGYVTNNPLRYVDMTGYCFLHCFWQPKHVVHDLNQGAKSIVNFAINPSAQNLFNMIHAQPGQAGVDQYVMSNPLIYGIGETAAGIATGFCYGCGAAAWNSYYSYLATGSVTESIRAGAIT